MEQRITQLEQEVSDAKKEVIQIDAEKNQIIAEAQQIYGYNQVLLQKVQRLKVVLLDLLNENREYEAKFNEASKSQGGNV